MSRTAETYDVRPDAKGRVILRGARSPYYSVTKKNDGSFVIRPRKLVDDSAAAVELGRLPQGGIRPGMKISGRLIGARTAKSVLMAQIDRETGFQPGRSAGAKDAKRPTRNAAQPLKRSTMAAVGRALKNLNAGKRSAPADLAKYAKYAE